MHKYFLIMLFCVSSVLFAGGQKEQNVYAPPEDQTVYIINNIDIAIDGQTKPFAVKDEANIHSGTLIQGMKNLELYIAEKKQFLISLRVFDEITLEYFLLERDEHNQIPVDLYISGKDSSNLIIFPIPKYSSNEGFSLKLSAKDFNFLGTLTPAELDVGYQRDTKGNNGFFLGSIIAVPFEFGGYRWTLDFGNSLDYSENALTYYYNHLGLLMDIPVKETTLTFGLYEAISVNEENYERNKASEGEYFRDGWYLNTQALARWNIPTGFHVFSFGELAYTPELDFSINYRPGGDIGDSRRGFEISLKQKLGFGKLNWNGNFREGLIADIQSRNTVNVSSGKWDNTLFVTGIYHRKFTDWTGFSGRIRWAHWMNYYYDGADFIRGIEDENNAGRDVIRGIADEEITADFMLSLNLQESFRVFRFMPSKWFNNPKLRFMDFEGQAAPFIDLALVQDPKHSRSFRFEDLIVTAGLELTAYSYYFQSVYFRVSYGLNLRKMSSPNALLDGEFYAGLGHYF